jgi:hypothetical protein
MMVFCSSAVCTIRLLSGIRSVVSQTILTGSFVCGRRQFNIGSSAITVSAPTMIPVISCRMRCTCSLAASPVIHFDFPDADAIFPSSVIAYFILT